MTDDLHSIARRIETLHAERDALGEDIAEAFKDAKKAKLDLPALRHALAERRRRDKGGAAYEALKGLAAEYLDALDNGVVVEHARAPARARGTDRAGNDGAPTVGGSGRVAPAAPPDAIPPSPAGGESDAGTLPTAAASSPCAVPAGDPDEHWEKRDGEGNFILALQVANGKVPHPAGEMPPIPAFLDRRRA